MRVNSLVLIIYTVIPYPINIVMIESLIDLHFLSHLIVELLRFLNLLCHGLLLTLILLDQLSCILYLVIDHSQTIRQCCLYLLLFLVNHHSSHLLVYFSILRQDLDFFEDKRILILLLVETVSGLSQLLSFFIELIIFLNLFLNLVLKSL